MSSALLNLDPTGTLSAAAAAISLVGAAVRLAPAVKNFGSSSGGGGGGRSVSGAAGVGPSPLHRSSTTSNIVHQVPAAPKDPERERRAYETVNFVLREIGSQLCAAGLVDEYALTKALTSATQHIEVNLFSGEANRLFESLAAKLADPILVNSVFTSIYFIGALTAELSSSLPNYKETYVPVGPRLVQQLFRAAIGEDAFRDNLSANLDAFKTLATTAGLLRPTDIGYSAFPKFPSFAPCKYSSRSFNDVRHNKSIYEKLVKHFAKAGFPQPTPQRQAEVGLIRDWRFLSGDANSRAFDVDKADKNLGENFGRVLHWLICSAERLPPGQAVIAYYDQHIELIKWIQHRMGYAILYPSIDLNLSGPHSQLDRKCRMTIDSWVVLMPSVPAQNAKRANAEHWMRTHMQTAAQAPPFVAQNPQLPPNAQLPPNQQAPRPASQSFSPAGLAPPSTVPNTQAPQPVSLVVQPTGQAPPSADRNIQGPRPVSQLVQPAGHVAPPGVSNAPGASHPASPPSRAPSGASAPQFATPSSTTVATTPPISAASTPPMSPAAVEMPSINDIHPAPKPIEQQIQEINQHFKANLVPQCHRLWFQPSVDAGVRDTQCNMLAHALERETIDRLNLVHLAENHPARGHRKDMIDQAQELMEYLPVYKDLGPAAPQGRQLPRALQAHIQQTPTQADAKSSAAQEALEVHQQAPLQGIHQPPHQKHQQIPHQLPHQAPHQVYTQMDRQLPHQMPQQAPQQANHQVQNQGTHSPGSSPPPYSPISPPSAASNTGGEAFPFPEKVKPAAIRRKAPPPPKKVISAKALYDFEPDADHAEELGFKEDDEIEIIEKNAAMEEDGWCRARVKGSKRIGLMPLEYLRILETQPAPSPAPAPGPSKPALDLSVPPPTLSGSSLLSSASSRASVKYNTPPYALSGQPLAHHGPPFKAHSPTLPHHGPPPSSQLSAYHGPPSAPHGTSSTYGGPASAVSGASLAFGTLLAPGDHPSASGGGASLAHSIPHSAQAGPPIHNGPPPAHNGPPPAHNGPPAVNSGLQSGPFGTLLTHSAPQSAISSASLSHSPPPLPHGVPNTVGQPVEPMLSSSNQPTGNPTFQPLPNHSVTPANSQGSQPVQTKAKIGKFEVAGLSVAAVAAATGLASLLEGSEHDKSGQSHSDPVGYHSQHQHQNQHPHQQNQSHDYNGYGQNSNEYQSNDNRTGEYAAGNQGISPDFIIEDSVHSGDQSPVVDLSAFGDAPFAPQAATAGPSAPSIWDSDPYFAPQQYAADQTSNTTEISEYATAPADYGSTAGTAEYSSPTATAGYGSTLTATNVAEDSASSTNFDNSQATTFADSAAYMDTTVDNADGTISTESVGYMDTTVDNADGTVSTESAAYIDTTVTGADGYSYTDDTVAVDNETVAGIDGSDTTTQLNGTVESASDDDDVYDSDC